MGCVRQIWKARKAAVREELEDGGETILPVDLFGSRFSRDGRLIAGETRDSVSVGRATATPRSWIWRRWRRAGRVGGYLNVELPVAAHPERARAAPRGTELH